MRCLLWVTSLAAATVWPSGAQDAIVDPGTSWELLGQGYQLTADSAVDRDGNVYFTDARKNRIWKIVPEGKIAVWKEDTHGTHGLAFGADGRLYGGQHDLHRIVAYTMDGVESVIADGLQTHHLTVTSRNRIYCAEAPAHRVWMVDAAGGKRVVSEAINFPRGVRASADGSVLVVNDPPTQWVWKFQIQDDGSLTGGQRFYRLEIGSDPAGTDAGGMVFDAEGFLYVATKTGVQVCDREGRVIAVLDTPCREGVANVWFAGSGLRWLYVTDGDKVYRRPAKRHGAVMP